MRCNAMVLSVLVVCESPIYWTHISIWTGFDMHAQHTRWYTLTHNGNTLCAFCMLCRAFLAVNFTRNCGRISKIRQMCKYALHIILQHSLWYACHSLYLIFKAYASCAAQCTLNSCNSDESQKYLLFVALKRYGSLTKTKKAISFFSTCLLY